MQKNSTFVLIILMLFFNLGCQKQDESQQSNNIRIQIQAVPEYKKVNYYYQEKTYRLEWTAYEMDHNQHVIKHHLQGDVSLEDIMPVMSSMVKTVFDPTKNPRADKIDTLVWGRIAPDNVSPKIELSKRLVVAAALSEEWDKQKGKVRKGKSINTWVKDLANQADIFFEVPEVFKEQGMELTISSVEKVLVSRADTLPYFEQIKKFGIKAEDKLPWDCQVWLKIEK